MSLPPSLDEHNRNVAKWRRVEREMRAKEAEEAAAKAAQEAAAGDVATVAEGVPAAPPGPGAPVPKTMPSAMEADPAFASGALADPTALVNPADPFAIPAEAASADTVPAAAAQSEALEPLRRALFTKARAFSCRCHATRLISGMAWS